MTKRDAGPAPSDGTPEEDPALDRDNAEAARSGPTADEAPTTPAPEPETATETTDRSHTTVEPADQQEG